MELKSDLLPFASLPVTQTLPSFVSWIFFLEYVMVLGITQYLCGTVINDEPRLLKQGPERTLPLTSEGLPLGFLSYCFY